MRTSLAAVLIWLLLWFDATMELSKGHVRDLAADAKETGD